MIKIYFLIIFLCFNSLMTQNAENLSGSYPEIGIIGGNTVIPHSIPYQVFIKVTNNNNTWRCGGSLITTNYVLTAASCVYGANYVDVILGAHNISEAESTQVKLRSDNITCHRDFSIVVDAFVYKNDIAVISLPESINVNDDIQTIQLPSSNVTSDTYINKTGKVSGWGLTDAYNSSSYSAVLLSQENTIISNEVCRLVYFDIKVFDICMDTKNDSPCVGDYGSPLTVDAIQIGIVSEGVMYCIPGYPYIYTRVSSFLDWIIENTDYEYENVTTVTAGTTTTTEGTTTTAETTTKATITTIVSTTPSEATRNQLQLVNIVGMSIVLYIIALL